MDAYYYADDICRVPGDGSFSLAACETAVPADHDGKQCRKNLKFLATELDELQRRFYAQKTHALLLIFQGMDAAGKDGTIRAVMREVDPAGCQVKSFKEPHSEELEHDFLWRTSRHLPARGHIGIFNRSYYEEVLSVRVRPELLQPQRLPPVSDLEDLWQQRHESIVQHEHHLVRNGTLVLKFFLNISAEEQRQRFLKRLKQPEKHWKFSSQDLAEREHWQAYMNSFEETLNATSRAWAPWYAIPADDKDYMRCKVAEIVTTTLRNLDPQYPQPTDEEYHQLQEARHQLKKE